MPNKIPHIVIGRLPLYLRVLTRLKREGKVYASSQELGKLLDISAAQIRKDLSHFGELGKRGTGYHIEYLINELGKILNTDTVWKMAVIGAGDVGHALANYNGFINRGFEVAAIFDCDTEKVGRAIGELTVKDCSEMQSVVDQKNIQIAVIATPAEAAQQVAEDLIDIGVKAILNYAPIFLKVPDDVHVEHFDPAVHLQKLSYYLE